MSLCMFKIVTLNGRLTNQQQLFIYDLLLLQKLPSRDGTPLVGRFKVA